MGNKRSLYPMESIQKRSGLEGTEFWRGERRFFSRKEKIRSFGSFVMMKHFSRLGHRNRIRIEKKYSNKIGTIFSRQYFILYYFYIIFDLFFLFYFINHIMKITNRLIRSYILFSKN